MKRFACSFIALVMFAAGLGAQELGAGQIGIAASLTSPSGGLGVSSVEMGRVGSGINQDGSLVQSTMYGAAVRYAISDSMATRMAFHFNVESWDYIKGSSIDDAGNFVFALEPAFLYELVQADDFSLYTGGQIGLRLLNSTIRPALANADTTEWKGFGLSASALAGAAYSFSRHLSVGAEYMFGFQRTSSEVTFGSQKSEASSTFFGLQGLRAYISFNL